MIEWNDDVAMAIENRIDAQVLRIDDIERKQAKRFPHLLEKLEKIFLRLDRVEQSVSALVNRLNSVNRELSNAVSVLENKQNAAMYNIQYPDDADRVKNWKQEQHEKKVFGDNEMDYSGAFESDIKE